MRNHRFALRALAVAAVLASAGQAKAEPTFLNSQAAYRVAFSAPGVDNFDKTPWADIGQFVGGTAGKHYHSAWAASEAGE